MREAGGSAGSESELCLPGGRRPSGAGARCRKALEGGRADLHGNLRTAGME